MIGFTGLMDFQRSWKFDSSWFDPYTYVLIYTVTFFFHVPVLHVHVFKPNGL